jgi:hypothetical protein
MSAVAAADVTPGAIVKQDGRNGRNIVVLRAASAESRALGRFIVKGRLSKGGLYIIAWRPDQMLNVVGTYDGADLADAIASAS